MQDQGKVYGFTISLYEYIETIPTLWDAVKEFISENPQYLPEDNAMQFLSDDGGETYNRCHCGSLSRPGFTKPFTDRVFFFFGQSGPTLKSATSTFGAEKPTPSSLNISIEKAGFTTNVGVMHRCTRSVRRFSQTRIRFTFLRILGIVMNRFNIVRRARL